MRSGKKFKRYAELLDDGRIEIHGDVNSVFVRKPNEDDVAAWPDLFPDGLPKVKRRRRKKVVDNGNAESATEHGDVGDRLSDA